MAMRVDDDDEMSENHEINVTPFIDVILVLLIIFMVAAPLATVDMPVDLPAATAEQKPRPDKPVYVTVMADASIAVGNDRIQRHELTVALERATEGDRTQRIFVRADKKVVYGDLIEVMDALRIAGYLKVALVTLDAGTNP